MRTLVLAILLAGCGTPSSKKCRVDVYAAADVDEQNPIECGAFELAGILDGGYTDPKMLDAQQCVLDAVAAERAFRLAYDVSDPVRHLRAGYTGFVQNQNYRLRSYAYVGDILGGSFDPRPHLTAQNCKQLSAITSCTPAVGRACLECEMPGSTSTLCRFTE